MGMVKVKERNKDREVWNAICDSIIKAMDDIEKEGKTYKDKGYKDRDILTRACKTLKNPIPISFLKSYLLHKSIEAINEIRLEEKAKPVYIKDIDTTKEKVKIERDWDRFSNL